MHARAERENVMTARPPGSGFFQALILGRWRAAFFVAALAAAAAVQPRVGAAAREGDPVEWR